MFHNNAHLLGRSGINRLMATTSIILILFLTIAGISASAQGGGGVLVIGTNAPQNLEPALGSNDPEILLNRSIYDYLMDVAADGSIQPNLGSEYTVSDDGLTYTVTLVEGVTFHDGSAFTSSDVVYTFNRLKELESPALSLLNGGDFEVAADGDTTAVFTLPQPNADFLFGLAGRLAFILSEDTATPNVIAEGDAPFVNFNGTGPFVLTEFSPGERAVLTRNENYWKAGQPVLDGVEFVYIEDPLAQIDALRSGAVNFIFKVPVDQLSTLESAEGITVVTKATNLHPVIRLRTAEGFRGTDVSIRRALKLGLDRDELNEVVLDGLGMVGNNDPIGPAYGPFYDDTIEKPQYDPEAACALIQEATGEERISFEFFVVESFNYPDLAQVMQQQWAEACIDVDLQVVSEGIYYSDAPNNWLTAELGLTGWGDRPIPQQYLLEAYVSDGPYNESNWNNAELDALVAEASVTTDIEARAAIYSQIAQIFADEGPIIIPYFAPMVGAVSDNVEGLEMAPFPGLTDLRTASVSQ